MLFQGYCVMLLVMTFNYPILITLCGGLTIGHVIFSIVSLPEMPSEYKQIAGSGAYLPEADNCCCKVEVQTCTNCPSEAKAGYKQVANDFEF